MKKVIKVEYKDIERIMKTTNGNHFGFDGMTITEMAQYTEYPEGGFYDWHVDNDVNCQHEPPVRKISMTCLLSPENEFVIRGNRKSLVMWFGGTPFK